MALARERARQHLAQRRVVVDEQDVQRSGGIHVGGRYRPGSRCTRLDARRALRATPQTGIAANAQNGPRATDPPLRHPQPLGRPLEPRDPGKVGIYACGPTVYDRIHVGNARPFVVFSLLKRFLEHEGHEVTLVVNITDVNDKIYDAARPLGVPSAQLARRWPTPISPTPICSSSAGRTTSRWRRRRSARSSR